MGAFLATRSPNERSILFEAVSSGKYLRLLNAVST